MRMWQCPPFLKLSGAMARQRDPLRALLQRYFFNGGKGKACDLACDLAAGNAGVAAGVGLVVVCGALTAGSGGLAGGPCLSGLSGVFVGGTATSVAVSSGFVGSYLCKQEMCSEEE